MRFKHFNENSALDSTVAILQKTFSDERRAVQDKVLEVVRMVQMGKGDKMELARAITELAKSELEVKRSDPDLKISVDQNMGMLDRAMKAVTGMSEGVTEDEIEEYKSIASLRNRSSLDALARLQDRNKPKTPKVIQIPNKQLELPFKKAVGEAGEEDPYASQTIMDEDPPLGINYDYANLPKVNWDKYSTKAIKEFLSVIENLDFESGYYSDDYDDMHFNAVQYIEKNVLAKRQDKSVKESSEMMTEAQFDEAAGEKDACYRKVKSRYKVWPSAYASGALVKCRKVGAANWGNSKK
tara:strand:+ start:2567 stop:3457 length:891 start_codon:yes stop_codon:yes gene_type:complete